MGQGGGREEGNLVVTPAASLRPSAERKGILWGRVVGRCPTLVWGAPLALWGGRQLVGGVRSRERLFGFLDRAVRQNTVRFEGHAAGVHFILAGIPQ